MELEIPTPFIFMKDGESIMRGCLQHDENDCGLACILTICKYLKICVDERNLRRTTYLGCEGLSLHGIIEVFREIGIDTLAVEGTDAELFATLAEEKKPILIMINEDNACHYVVVYKERSNGVYLWDPNRGKRVVSRKYFNEIWSGYAVCITEAPKAEGRKLHKKSICWSTLFQQKKCLALLLLFSIILLTVSLSTTYIYKNVIEQIELGIQVFTPQLKRLFFAMGICYILIYLLFVIKEKLIAYLKKELGNALENKFVKSILNISIPKRDDYTSGGILDRYYELSVVVDTMVSVFSSVLLECIALIAGIIILTSINTTMFGIVMIIIVAYVISFIVTKKTFYVLSKTIMDKESILITHIKETIDNLISLKGFENNKYQRKIEHEINFIKNKEYILDKLSIHLQGALDAIESVTMLLVLIYGIQKVIGGNMSLGTLIAFQSFVGVFLSPVKNLLGILPSVQETILTFRRIEDVFVHDESPEEKEQVDVIITGGVYVDGLDVAYGYEQPILSNISFDIKAGETVFLMGASGCGKSTLAKTLAGIVQYKNGRIIWDNDINADIADLTKQVLYLPQNAEIFSGSIKDNIVMWEKEYDSELFDEVIAKLGINQVMSARGLDVDSQLMENGTNLSGGERQRIALARAIMKKPPVYIFDEATCHLDSENEKNIMDCIRKKCFNHTCIIISHNTSLLKDDDNVIFIDCVGNLHKNTHLQMIKSNVEYRQMLEMS